MGNNIHLSISGQPLECFSIVYQIDSVWAMRLAKKISSHLRDIYHVSLQIGGDGQFASHPWEILIGNTHKTTETVEALEFAVCLNHGRLQVLACGALAYEELEKYLKTVLFTTQNLSLEDGFCERVNIKNVILDDRKYAFERCGDFRLMSANICGSYGRKEPNLVVQNAYRSERMEYFKESVLQYAPDAIGIQEAGPEWRAYPWMVNYLLPAIGYEEVFCGNENFTPVFYLREKFDVIDKGFHIYSGANNSNSKSFTWAVLKNKITRQTVGTFSTHYYYTGDEVGKETRKQNSRELSEKIMEVSKQYRCPFVGCGDFNSLYHEPPHDILKMRGFVSALDSARIKSRLGTCHNGPQYDLEAGVLTTRLDDVRCDDLYAEQIIDHVYTYGEEIEAKLLNVPMSETALLSTDHTLVICDVDFSDMQKK